MNLDSRCHALLVGAATHDGNSGENAKPHQIDTYQSSDTARTGQQLFKIGTHGQHDMPHTNTMIGALLRGGGGGSRHSGLGDETR